MDPTLFNRVGDPNGSLSLSLCLVCCSKVDLNISQIVESNSNDIHSGSVDKNLGIIFLLKKLLIVPDHQLKRNLKECGNPEDWGISLCVECTLLIRQARDLHGLILKIERKLKDVQKIIVDKTKKSSLSSTSSPIKNKQLVNKAGDLEKKSEIWRRTREFVKSHNYSEQFVNPFVEGDKLAKSFGRQERQQQKPIPVNLNNVKNEVVVVPSPQIEVELEGVAEEDEVPFNGLEDEDDDMDWDWEEEDPLGNDDEGEVDVEIGETKCTRLTGNSIRKSKVTKASPASQSTKRVQRPNIIVDGKYKCRYCEEDTFFDKRKACIYHESKHLKGAPLTTRPYQKRIYINGKWKCRHCDQFFNTIKALHGHEKEKHVSIKGQFVCDLCGKTFNSKKYLQSHHYQYHGVLASGAPVRKKEKKVVEQLICNICGSTFLSQQGLRNHLLVTHAGIFKFECEICGRKIPTSTALKKHMLRMHKDEEVTKRMVREEGLRLWGCELKGCNGNFMSKSSLDKHVEKVHGNLGEGEMGKRFNCEICGRGFWERSKLKRHELIHKKNKICSDPLK